MLIIERRYIVPPQVQLTPTDFESIHAFHMELGFREITSDEVQEDFLKYGLKAPRRIEGKEVGFLFSGNGLTIRVWTSWLAEEGRMRVSDSGWVLIIQDGSTRYFCHPLHRTKHFVKNLNKQAEIAYERVVKRPRCPECGEFMDIAGKKEDYKAKFWQCSRRRLHLLGGYNFRQWDYPLSPENLKFKKGERRKREKQRLKRQKEGKVIVPAWQSRKTWHGRKAERTS